MATKFECCEMRPLYSKAGLEALTSAIDKIQKYVGVTARISEKDLKSDTKRFEVVVDKKIDDFN